MNQEVANKFRFLPMNLRQFDQSMLSTGLFINFIFFLLADKDGEQVDAVSKMGSCDPRSFVPVMMLLAIPVTNKSFGAFPLNTNSGSSAGFSTPVHPGIATIPVLVAPSNFMALTCLQSSASGENSFPSFNAQAMPSVTSLCEMFRGL